VLSINIISEDMFNVLLRYSKCS